MREQENDFQPEKKPTKEEAVAVLGDPNCPESKVKTDEELAVVKRGRNFYGSKGWEPSWQEVRGWLKRDSE